MASIHLMILPLVLGLDSVFGFSVLMEFGKAQRLGSVGNYGWGGAANTNFWIDPQEELIGTRTVQFMPSDTSPVTADFRNLTYQALIA